MVYRPIVVEDPPSSWEEIIQTGNVLSFPAADPQALFTLAMYQSLGGELLSETGELLFDPILLESVLDYYQQAESADVMPYMLTQFDSDELSWQAFLGNSAHMSITWATRFFDQNTDNIQATPIPTFDGTTQTLATGWVWTLTGNDPTRYEIAVELAEFLTEGEFLGEWTSASGYLPTRPSALSVWPADQKQALASQILSSARAKPDESIFFELGDLLTQAVIGVLKDEISAEDAAKMVVEGLGD
jgi:ABC-type glycerol-3-phosphate transport system substrate-binding protein